MAKTSDNNVTPCMTRNNGLQVCEFNAEGSGYLFTGYTVSKHLLHLPYLILRKLRDMAAVSSRHIVFTANHPVLLSLAYAAFSHHVSRIILGCASFKVCWVAASRIIAKVHSDKVADVSPKGENQGDSVGSPVLEVEMRNPVPEIVNAALPHPTGFSVSDRDIAPKPSLLVLGQDWVWSKLGISHMISLNDRWLGPCGVYETPRGSSYFTAA